MEKLLKDFLIFYGTSGLEQWANWQYSENCNPDVLDRTWVEKRTPFIYKVGVMAAIDSNKCDWAYIAIGAQRHEGSEIDIVGHLKFKNGENDDMGRTMKRAFALLSEMHPAFDPE